MDFDCATCLFFSGCIMIGNSFWQRQGDIISMVSIQCNILCLLHISFQKSCFFCGRKADGSTWRCFLSAKVIDVFHDAIAFQSVLRAAHECHLLSAVTITCC